MIPVSRLWHKRGKLEYFTILQLVKFFPEIEFYFHIVLDDYNYKDEWSEKIDNLPAKFFWYSKDDMHKYLDECNYNSNNLISKIPNFIHFYHILINHYLRRVYNYDYTLSIEYDVIFNSSELTELTKYILKKIPFGIIEPANLNCDKALSEKLSNIFSQNIVKYNNIGFNAGFQGINLQIFDEFLNPSSFDLFISCFDFSGIYDKNGKEKTGWVRTIIDTQEQSFHSLMNALSPDFNILNPLEYYVFPYWVDMEYLKKSKVIHFIGHEKPKEMIEMIDLGIKKLENKNYE